jgi:hypothetical protein
MNATFPTKEVCIKPGVVQTRTKQWSHEDRARWSDERRTSRCEPGEWSSTCVGAAIPPGPRLGVGATATHVWHLMDFVDTVRAARLGLLRQ